MELPAPLRDALDAACDGTTPRELTAAVDRMITSYRSGEAPQAPIVASAVDATAYAAYRMPATYAAVRTVLAQVRSVASVPIGSQVDVGGGTGAAVWAALDAYPGIAAVTVLDQSADALALGRRLANRSTAAALRTATWRQDPIEASLPAADLLTISYVLGELGEAAQASLVRRAAAAGQLVVIVEPGTPDGYRRILTARTALLEAGFHVIAPCPHQGPCPIAPGRDWCHFAARVNRSALHRRLKRAELNYEDEKLSYVAAARSTAGTAPGRILRHPQHRKGLVSLQVCTPDAGIVTDRVPRSQGDRYRAARDVSWGDPWPGPVA